MLNKQIKIDPFFNSIFLKHLYTHFIKMGAYYKLYIYFFFLNKLLKKKKVSIFILMTYIIEKHYFSLGTKKKALFKVKKKAKKFKRKKKNKKKNFKKLFQMKLIHFPHKKFFKIIKKFYRAFLLKKNNFFLAKIYNSYIKFFFINNINKNKIKKLYVKEKRNVTNIFKARKRNYAKPFDQLKKKKDFFYEIKFYNSWKKRQFFLKNH